MMNLRVIFRVALAGAMAGGLLFAAAVVLLMPTRTHAEEGEQPKLLWEKAFDGEILAVGVDDEGFARTKGDIASCLKWIVFAGGEVRFFDGSGGLRPEPLEGRVEEQDWVSPSGRYFFTARRKPQPRNHGEPIHYTMLDWDGHEIWKTDETEADPLVSNDGSAVFLQLGRRDHSYVHGFSFYDPHGKVNARYSLPESQSGMAGTWGISDSFFVAPTYRADKRGELVLFDRKGDVIWRQAMPMGGEMAVVSERGEVLLLEQTREPAKTEILVYDPKGALVDEVQFYPRGFASPLVVDGDIVLVPTWVLPDAGSHFLCYDLRGPKTRFVLDAGKGRFFGNSDADRESRVVAVAVHSENRLDADVVEIYGIDGAYKGQVGVQTPSHLLEFWFKLLDGSLLVAEGKNLRLYTLEGGE